MWQEEKYRKGGKKNAKLMKSTDTIAILPVNSISYRAKKASVMFFVYVGIRKADAGEKERRRGEK